MSYTSEVITKLRELGLELPTNSPPPAGNYAPFCLHDGIGSPAAQTSGYDGSFSGQVGKALTLDQGQKAAELTAFYALAHIH